MKSMYGPIIRKSAVWRKIGLGHKLSFNPCGSLCVAAPSMTLYPF
jgi:hypothetical protein